MFNFWIVFFFFSSLSIVVSFMFITNPLHILFLSELNWVLLITNTILLASVCNDPRFFLLTFIFLFFAAVEIVLYITNFIFKDNQCLNFFHIFGLLQPRI